VTTFGDGKPAPKVIDFGIAKAITGQQLTDKTIFTAYEMLIGTPAYMKPGTGGADHYRRRYPHGHLQFGGAVV